MNSVSKFNLNDEVFFLHEGKILCSKITRIDTSVSTHTWDNSFSVKYFVNVGTEKDYKCEIITENNCFSSRQELIDSL